MKETVQRKSKYDEHFEQIKASPEQVAKAVMQSPNRKGNEWKYKKEGKKV